MTRGTATLLKAGELVIAIGGQLRSSCLASAAKKVEERASFSLLIAQSLFRLWSRASAAATVPLRRICLPSATRMSKFENFRSLWPDLSARRPGGRCTAALRRSAQECSISHSR